eukprot:4582864-Ditylum_brightwellii.AAC.1
MANSPQQVAADINTKAESNNLYEDADITDYAPASEMAGTMLQSFPEAIPMAINPQSCCLVPLKSSSKGFLYKNQAKCEVGGHQETWVAKLPPAARYIVLLTPDGEDVQSILSDSFESSVAHREQLCKDRAAMSAMGG